MLLHSPSAEDNHVQPFATITKYLQRILLPVYADLPFRLAFRLLPVRSRFCFLEVSDPRICGRAGCTGIETERHLFFECEPVIQMCNEVHQMLSPFLTARVTWLNIAIASRGRIQWKLSAEVVFDVRHTLRVLTLHFL